MKPLLLTFVFGTIILGSFGFYRRSDQNSNVFASIQEKIGSNQPPHQLWPAPASYTFGNKQITINDPCNFSFATTILNSFPEVGQIFSIYRDYMFSSGCSSLARSTRTTTTDPNSILNIRIKDTSSLLMNLDTDEAYILQVQDQSFVLNANTYVGALRGLETFSQLVSATQDPHTGRTIFVIPATPVAITDYPRFAHRGLLLDTSRHFISKDNILKILDGLMFSKLNVFHWHLADSDSFPFYFPSHPNLTLYGAYGPKQVYSQKDIQDIVEYAILRGIRIIPELDSPAHVGGLAYSPEGKPLINCTQQGQYDGMGVPLGQINPILNETYALIKDLLDDLDEYFPWEFVHLGADEVEAYCWNNTDIYHFMANNNITDFAGLFNYYVDRERQLVNPNKTRVYWLAVATEYLKFKPEEIVQWWGETQSLAAAFAAFPNNKFILSNYDYFYLDCGFGSYFGQNSWCDPMHTWLNIAQFPLEDIQQHLNQVLGLEVCLWSELVNDAVVLGRAFPRAASLGEKGWSQDTNTTSDSLSVVTRLNAWITRSNNRGLPTGPVTTGFCENHPAGCFS